MGLFDKAKAIVRDAKWWIEDKIWEISYKLGKKKSVSSQEDKIDAEKELNVFKEKLDPVIGERESTAINGVMEKFSEFACNLHSDYPELSEKIISRGDAIIDRLKGTIKNHIDPRLSINNDELRKILNMQPGIQKENDLKRYQEQLLLAGETGFKSKLQHEMDNLYNEISERLNAMLSEKTGKLEKLREDYNNLRDLAEKGQLDLEKIKQDCVPIEEACKAVEYLLEKASDRSQ